MFTVSSPEHERPNIQFHVQPLSLDRFGEPLHRFAAITASACNLRPTSRGDDPAALGRSGRRARHRAELSGDRPRTAASPPTPSASPAA